MLLIDNDIYVNGEKGAPAEASAILKQQPNIGIWLPWEDFLGANDLHWLYISPTLGIYNWGNGKEKNLFSRIGSPPVILDTTKVEKGAQQLQIWYFNNGYFNATSSYAIDSLQKKSQKAEAIYRVKTGSRYYIDSISKEINNKHLFGLTVFFREDSHIKPGDPYNADNLNKERRRLAEIFRNHGYYNFNHNYITFEADTFNTGDTVDIRMIISDRPVEQGDSTIYKPHEVYRINEVYIRPDKDYVENDAPADTLLYRDYQVLYDTLKYKPRYLTDAVHFKRGDKYEERKVKDTYSHLVGYKAFQLSEVTFQPGPRDSAGPTLNAFINLSPLAKRTWTFEPELTNTSGSSGLNLGVRATTGWTNRNFLGAGEALEVRFTAGREKQPTPGSVEPTTTFEIGTEVSLRFPRFLLPFNTVGLLPKRMQPQSRVSASVSRLNRIEFDRTTFNTQLSYNWRESRRKSHQVDLLDISYSLLDSVQQNFLENLTPIQVRAFQSEFITATRYTYTINEQVELHRTNYRFLRVSVEEAGLFLGLYDRAFRFSEELPSGQQGIFNVQYFQYVTLDVDARYYWNFQPQKSWINRIYSGYILPFGNSRIGTDSASVRIPPFSKYFYMGGSNDLRAWAAYRLGAGTQNNTNYRDGLDTSFATGTFKLLFNSEYRFPLVSSLRGALFIDAGNVWYTGGLQDENSDLNLKALYRELAIGTGIGVRLDLDFFVIRFDVGMKVRDPGLIDENEEWVILTQPNYLKNLTYNIALGYPF